MSLTGEMTRPMTATETVERICQEVCSRVKIEDPPILLIDLVIQIVLDLLLYADDESADEVGEQLTPLVSARLIDATREAERKNRILPFELHGFEFEYIRGSSFPDQSLNSDHQLVRRRRAKHNDVLKELQNLNWREFEIVCMKVLQMLGCSDPRVTSRSDDGGIDFFGKLSLKGRLDNLSPLGGFDQRMTLWMIGQAKFYRAINTVGPDVVRELVGSVELARTKGTSHVWNGLEVRAFEPIVILIFTTGEFSNKAMELLRDSGVLYMDGGDLAVFLTDNGVGITDGAGFTRDEFRRLLGLCES